LSTSTLVLANRAGSALLIICASRMTWPSNSRKAASFAVIASRSGSSAAYARLRRSVLAAGSASTSAVVVLTAVSAPVWRGLRALALTFSPAPLRNFGLKVGMVGTVKFEARIKELVENLPDLAVLVEPLLVVLRVLREQFVILHRRLLVIVRDDEVCRRLMTTPGVGPVVALTYRATVDVPARFRKSKAVGAVFGLTCSKYQSGEIDWSGRISRCGDEMMRAMLYEAAQSMLVRSTRWSWLKAWAMQIARRRGMKKAIVALARRLAVIMHRIWVDGTEFRWTREQSRGSSMRAVQDQIR
jgi:hypothetical protein